MIRLGWRLAAAGGRASAVAIGLTAVAVAVGTAILLFALSFEPALGDRYDRGAWRDTSGQLDLTTADTGLIVSRTDDRWRGRALTRMDLASLSGDAPVPPGLDAVPGPGEALLSPALAALVAEMPADELGERFGRVVGQIGRDGLRAPDELLAVVGRDPEALRRDGGRAVTVLDGSGDIPTPPDPIIRVLVVIAVVGALAPVAVFVATATRLSAARREQRLAALRLVGATPGQVALFAAVEAALATIPGALGGVALFLLARPVVAQVPLDQAAWFPESIAPPLLPAIGLLLLVQVVGVVSAIVALRRVAASPLGVRRRERPRPLGRLRLVPLVVSLVALAAAVVRIAGAGDGVTDDMLWLLAGSFFGTIVGIAIAGPWVTALVGAAVTRLARGPVGLLAGRRLADDPRAAFGAIGGVVMAVFIGSAYLSIAGFAGAASIGNDGLGVRPDVLVASVPGDGAGADDALARLATVAGVQATTVIREVLVDSGTTTQRAVVADCVTLVALLDAPNLECGTGLVHLGPGVQAFAGGTLRSLAPMGVAPPEEDVSLAVPPAAVDRYAPETLPEGAIATIPALIIEPEAVRDGLAFLPPTRLAIRTDGSAAAIERARTAVQVEMPTSVAWTFSEVVTAASAVITELGRVVSIGVVAALLIAGASLAVAVVTGLVERRRPFGLLRLSGLSIGRLRAVLVVEAAAPLVAVAALSAVLGMGVAQLLLRALSTRAVPPPDLALVALLGVAVAGALGVVALTLPVIDRVTSTEATRFE